MSLNRLAATSYVVTIVSVLNCYRIGIEISVSKTFQLYFQLHVLEFIIALHVVFICICYILCFLRVAVFNFIILFLFGIFVTYNSFQ
jgi:hypothetical protein